MWKVRMEMEEWIEQQKGCARPGKLRGTTYAILVNSPEDAITPVRDCIEKFSASITKEG